MKKRQGIIFGVVFIFILFAAIVFFMKNQEFDEPVSKSDFKLNTVVTVTIYDLEGKKAEAIIDKALKLCDKYEKIFSRTLPESEIYELNHGTLPQEGRILSFIRRVCKADRKRIVLQRTV